jgi:glyceraldehyde 3-phosphate dehydrogenase
MARLRVGINGFGRIGRILFRAGFDRIEVAGINDMTDAETLAHLLKYDSTHGVMNAQVKTDGNSIVVNDRKIPVSSTKNPAEIPWKDWGVDLVLECTGAFKKREEFMSHLKGGAKRVLVSAPADGVDNTFVYGVNHEAYDPSKHIVVSNASCTTNCLAPIAQVLHKQFGIEHGLMTTIHSYTNDQRVLDAPHKDLRRARSAALSMIPTTTGAAKTGGNILPELAGRLDGTSVRVPTPNVSLVDFVAVTKNEVSVQAVNEALISAAQGPLKGVLACEANELVSVDFNGNPHSSIVDLQSTMTMGPHMVKVLSWYDNEVGFSHRMIDFALYMNSRGL